MIGPKLSGALPTDKPPFNRIFLGKAFMSIKLIKMIKKNRERVCHASTAILVTLLRQGHKGE